MIQLFEELNKHKFVMPNLTHSRCSDSPRLKIDIFEDEEVDEILFPWISFFKENFGETYETNKQIHTLWVQSIW